VEKSRHRQPFRHGRTVGQVRLGGVGRRENGTGRGAGKTSFIQGGRCHWASVCHARASARKPAVSPRQTVLSDDDHRQRQHNDDLQGHKNEREEKVSKSRRQS